MAFDQTRLGNADIDYLMIHFSLDLPLLSLAESRSIPYLDVAYKQLTSGLNFDDCSAQLDEDGLKEGLKNHKFHSFLLSCFASLGYQVKNIIADKDGVKLIKTINGNDYPVSIGLEGHHLSQFLSISGNLYKALLNGKALFLDNLDTFSTKEIEFLVSLFNSKDFDQQSQLVFVSSNLSLLDRLDLGITHLVQINDGVTYLSGDSVSHN